MKKIVSLLLALVLVFSLTGCMGNLYEYAGTIDGEDISSGLYLMAQLSAHREAEEKAENKDKDVLSQKIEGKSAKSWIQDRTEELLRRYVLVQRMAAEKGLTLSEENKNMMAQNEQYWSILGPYYEKNGVSKETWGRYSANAYLADQLFTQLYGKDGELASPDSELMKEYEEKFARVSYLTISIKNDEDEVVENLAEVEAAVQALVEQLKKGTSIDELSDKGLSKVFEMLGKEFDPEVNGVSAKSFIAYEPENFDVYSEEFLKQLREQSVGDVGMYTAPAAIIIYEKVDTFEDQAEFDEMRDSVLRSLRTDAFDQYLRDIYSEYPVSWRFGARWFLRPSKIQ